MTNRQYIVYFLGPREWVVLTPNGLTFMVITEKPNSHKLSTTGGGKQIVFTTSFE
jgi:hypothetical protein